MRIRLTAVEPADDAALHALHPGAGAEAFVDYTWYWRGVAARRDAVEDRAIRLDSETVGYAAFGAHCRDRALRRRVADAAEVYHLVVDAADQGRGIARRAMAIVLSELFTAPGSARVLVAVNPENGPARTLYESLGFGPVDARNYDGDPMLELKADIWRPPALSPELGPPCLPVSIDRAAWAAASRRAEAGFEWEAWESG